jgi:hypothetical protein
MLRIAARPEWTHEVTISVPVDGGFENQTCKVRYRLLDETAIKPTDPTNVVTLLRDVVVRMDDVADEAGQPLAWNDALRDHLLAVPFVQAALVRGYYGSVTGARAGNFAGSGAPGPRVA